MTRWSQIAKKVEVAEKEHRNKKDSGLSHIFTFRHLIKTKDKRLYKCIPTCLRGLDTLGRFFHNVLQGRKLVFLFVSLHTYPLLKRGPLLKRKEFVSLGSSFYFFHKTNGYVLIIHSAY